MRLVKAIAAAIGLVLLLWGTGCAHRYTSQQSAQRTEETRKEWKTAETAASQTQSVATEKKQGRRETKKFSPSGQLLEQVIEQWGSDGRVQVDTSASSHAESTGHDFRSVRASSSSSTKADTRAGVNPWWWLLLLVPVAAGGWALKRYWRSVIPW